MKKNKIFKLGMLVAAFGFMCSLQSCTKALQGLHFDLGMQTQTVTVTVPVTPAGTVSIGPVTTSYNVDSFIHASTGNQLGINNIYSVKLTSVVLTLNNATPTNNFGNFQSVNASFFSNSNSTPYTINVTDNPSTDVNTLTLPGNSDELKSYIGTQFTYNLSGALRAPITTTLTCTVQFNYDLIVQG